MLGDHRAATARARRRCSARSPGCPRRRGATIRYGERDLATLDAARARAATLGAAAGFARRVPGERARDRARRPPSAPVALRAGKAPRTSHGRATRSRAFGMPDLEHRDVRTLSGGERRRVALAALLVQDAPLALLDEPSSHLDVAQQASALEVFVQLARAREPRGGDGAARPAPGDALLRPRDRDRRRHGDCRPRVGDASTRRRCRRCSGARWSSCRARDCGRSCRRLILAAERERHLAPVRSPRTARRRLRRSAAPAGAGGRRRRPAAGRSRTAGIAASGASRRATRARCAPSLPAMIVSGRAAITASIETCGAGIASDANTFSPPHARIASRDQVIAADREQRRVPDLVEHAHAATRRPRRRTLDLARNSAAARAAASLRARRARRASRCSSRCRRSTPGRS